MTCCLPCRGSRFCRWGCTLLLGLLVAGALFLGPGKDRLLRNWLTRTMEQKTGFSVQIGHLGWSLPGSRFRLEDLSVSNPPEFKGGQALVLKELSVEYRFWSLFGAERQVPRMVVDLPLIRTVVLGDGRSNLETFSEGLSSGDAEAEGEVPRDYRIGRLAVRLGRMSTVVIDEAGGAPMTQDLELGIEEEFENVTDLQQVMDPLVQALMLKLLPQMMGEDYRDAFKILEEEGTWPPRIPSEKPSQPAPVPTVPVDDPIGELLDAP